MMMAFRPLVSVTPATDAPNDAGPVNVTPVNGYVRVAPFIGLVWDVCPRVLRLPTRSPVLFRFGPAVVLSQFCVAVKFDDDCA